MSILSRFKESRIGQFWLKHEQKIILAIGIILIAAISFEAGFLKGQQNKQESVVVNKTTTAAVAGASVCPEQAEKSIPINPSVKTASAPTETNATNDNQKCSFVASKNSNKYHLLTCRYAQNIKPENKVCFSSKEEAESRGFQGAKCCIK